MDIKSMEKRDIKVNINGTEHACSVETRVNLADFLRHQIGLTGTHVGCEHGVCGACTVLVEGQSVRACLMLAAQADGKRVVTVEGLTPADGLSPLQQSFWDKHGLQCGYCTPGVLVSLTELLESNASPTEAEVREVLSGHLCRCTGYQNIVAAAMDAAEQIKAAKLAALK
jgi:aerobic-type carbon monoxide dehydrogenase small subunit (CoxS/CutS family)